MPKSRWWEVESRRKRRQRCTFGATRVNSNWRCLFSHSCITVGFPHHCTYHDIIKSSRGFHFFPLRPDVEFPVSPLCFSLEISGQKWGVWKKVEDGWARVWLEFNSGQALRERSAQPTLTLTQLNCCLFFALSCLEFEDARPKPRTDKI